MRRGGMRPSGDPERIFDAFVKNAVGDIDVTRNERPPEPEPRRSGKKRRDPMAVAPPPTFEDAPLPDWMTAADDDEKETTAEIVLLTKVKPAPARPARAARARRERAEPQDEPQDDTMRLEAALAVPDIASVKPPPLPVREASEDGQIPAGELDRVLSDMMVLARYGHFDEVRERLEAVTRKYPEDVLLLRRVVELHIEIGDRFGAIESLFTLALRLFERRNVVGMRQALEQVLVIEPDNRRAYKLLGLLEQRPSTGTG